MSKRAAEVEICELLLDMYWLLYQFAHHLESLKKLMILSFYHFFLCLKVWLQVKDELYAQDYTEVQLALTLNLTEVSE